MEHQQLIHITRGLQNAAAETNTLVAQQYIRVLSEFFERQPDGTLKARMVRVELDEEHYSMVPLVSLAAPTGLALDRMRVQLSIKLESAQEEHTRLLSVLKAAPEKGEDGEEKRSQFTVSLSPRSGKGGKKRPSDHVNIDLEFRALETPESIQRVIDVYTNMMQPLRKKPNDGAPAEPEPTPPDSPQPDEGARNPEAEMMTEPSENEMESQTPPDTE